LGGDTYRRDALVVDEVGRMGVSIEMGRSDLDQPVTLDIEELLATRLLVQGASGSGKSYLLRRLLEQSAPLIQQCVIDPEGDFVSLGEAFGHVIVDAGGYSLDALRRAAMRSREARISVILNLENLEVEAQLRAVAAWLTAMFDVPRELWFPMLVIVDEAQIFAPAAGSEGGEDARRQSLLAMTNLFCRGRKRGLAGVMATQRLAKIAKNVASECNNLAVGCTTMDIDLARAAELLGIERRAAESLRDLPRGSFLGFGPAIARRPTKMRIGPVVTASLGGTPKLTPPPRPIPSEARELLIAAAADTSIRVEKAAQPQAAGLDMFARLAEAAQTTKTREPRDHSAAEIEAALFETMGERDNLFRSAHASYRDFLTRCRARGVRGERVDLVDYSQRVTDARSRLFTEGEPAELWVRAMEISTTVPEDLRGIYLLAAEAVVASGPAPSDATIARLQGSGSINRGRRILGFLEERSLLVVETDKRGQRTIAVASLGSTAPADPRGADGVLLMQEQRFIS
jgi:energy-coupling factor transporter ATP-binding protein EcfA2